MKNNYKSLLLCLEHNVIQMVYFLYVLKNIHFELIKEMHIDANLNFLQDVKNLEI